MGRVAEYQEGLTEMVACELGPKEAQDFSRQEKAGKGVEAEGKGFAQGVLCPGNSN